MNAPNTDPVEQTTGIPTNDQLTLILENLFERQRLMELAHRCSTRDDTVDLRQARTHELIEILLKAWEVGPRRSYSSVWGAVDMELAGRLKGYLGLGENKLREMLAALQGEGALDRKTSASLLWVLLHERHEQLLAEYESILSYRYRDTGSVFMPKSLYVSKIAELNDQIERIGRELKGLVILQTQEIEKMSRRLEEMEKKREGGLVPGRSESLERRFQNVARNEVRVGVFVDVQNMFYAAKKINGARLDYESMLDAIVSGRRLIKALAYIVESADIDQSGFISVLEKKGYQVRRKELKSFFDGTAKGDWDMGIAIDIIEMAAFLDVVALVSGDGDFVSLVRLVKKIGPKVELYAFGHNLSSELRETADQFIELGPDLLLKNHHQTNHTADRQEQNGRAAATTTTEQPPAPERDASGGQ
ncbi:NYN domain-containing protein [bacterium]|nr:NYN domain-containing protein [bacterium]